MLKLPKPFHPVGEAIETQNLPEINECTVDTYGGCVHIEWEPQAPVTPIGQLPFFRLRRGVRYDFTPSLTRKIHSPLATTVFIAAPILPPMLQHRKLAQHVRQMI